MVHQFPHYMPVCFNRLATCSIWIDPLHQADVEFLQATAQVTLADDIPVQSNSVAIDFLVGSNFFEHH